MRLREGEGEGEGDEGGGRGRDRDGGGGVLADVLTDVANAGENVGDGEFAGPDVGEDRLAHL
jgi:hypothetical protein